VKAFEAPEIEAQRDAKNAAHREVNTARRFAHTVRNISKVCWRK